MNICMVAGDEDLAEFLHREIGMMLGTDGNVTPETEYSIADMQARNALVL